MSGPENLDTGAKNQIKTQTATDGHRMRPVVPGVRAASVVNSTESTGPVASVATQIRSATRQIGESSARISRRFRVEIGAKNAQKSRITRSQRRSSSCRRHGIGHS
jgi:hypothetical protein